MQFTHLHVHSHYSLLDGLPKIDELVARAKECKMDSSAITDHGVMYGVIEFYQVCREAGIKPIIGVEFYVAPNGRLNKRPKVDEERHHLILLAKNEEGYKNLLKLTSKAHLEGFYYKPRVDLEALKEYSGGLIALTACLQGEIPRLIMSGKLDKAREVAREYEEIYGEGNFYLEVQHHPNLKEQGRVNEALLEISGETGIPCVATNDVHYLEPSDAEAQDILLCLQTKKKREDTDRMNMTGEDFSFRSAEEMSKGFSLHPEVLKNTQKIAEMCNLKIKLGKIKLPYFSVPNGMTNETYLEKLCAEGLKERYGIDDEGEMRNEKREKRDDVNEQETRNHPTSDHPQGDKKQETRGDANLRRHTNDTNDASKENPIDLSINEADEWRVTSDKQGVNEKTVRERLEYELKVIESTGFAPYFLIVADFVNWAKNNKIVVGPGRGSAAGSLVSYLLNITDIDPIEYELLFERFLNPERISMPDIDLDFADNRRDEVIEYVCEKYGRDHVSQIITFGTMAARAAVRDVGRVLGMSYNFCDAIAKMIPMFASLDKALEINLELKETYKNDPEAKRLLDMARKLEGVARHASTHACGLVITKEPSDNYIPLQYDTSSNGKTVVSQYSMKPIEDLGLLKMDFLGLKNLTIIERTLKQVKYNHGLDIKLDDIPLDDGKTFKLLQDGDTTGVFQMESSGMKRYLKQLKPTGLEDIIAMVSLYRPGPMEWIPDYIDGKQGKKKPYYLHPKLEPILEKTYGVAIYQEQVLKIARDLAGFTLGEADILRKAVGKKIKKLLAEQRQKFIDGCIKNRVDKRVAEKVFSFIEPFAGYGFNRSHAACYALIAFQTAYLKANFPAEFMASLLTSDQHDTDRIAIEVEECREMGIRVLPPDINESFKRFAVVKGDAGEQKKRKEKREMKDDTNGGRGRKGAIRFGLLAIKNVGEHIVEVLVKERQENGPYLNLEDFLERVQDKDLNKKSLESLIKSGALDRFGDRNQLLLNLETMLAYSKNIQQEKTSAQANLFFGTGRGLKPSLTLQATGLADKRTKLSWEKELLGLYISEHPFREFEGHLRNVTKRTSEIKLGEDSYIKVAGVITSIKKIITKSNEPMLFVKIEDTVGVIETLVFPRTLKETLDVWQEEKTVVISGRVSDKDGVAKILCDRVWGVEINDLERLIEEVRSYTGNGYYSNQGPGRGYGNYLNFRTDAEKVNVNKVDKVNKVNNLNNLATKKIEITVPVGLSQEKSTALKSLLKQNEGGEYKVCFAFPNRETGAAKKVITNYRIKFDEEMRRGVEAITGKGSVLVS